MWYISRQYDSMNLSKFRQRTVHIVVGLCGILFKLGGRRGRTVYNLINFYFENWYEHFHDSLTEVIFRGPRIQNLRDTNQRYYKHF